MEPKRSSYMLIFRDAPPDVYLAMSEGQRENCLQDWNDWYDGLAAKGKLEHGHPLQPVGRVVSGKRGERVVDGPFAEAKEFVGGYFLLTVASLDEATQIAQHCPNLKHGMTVEVRPVGETCPLAQLLGRSTMKGDRVTVPS